MGSTDRNLKGWVLFLMTACLTLTGCATLRPAEPTKAGDKVRVDFTCRIGNGEIASTTDRGISADPDMKKAPVFQARKSEDPLVITAGRDDALYGKTGERGFEGEIVAEMAEAVVGMRPGEIRQIQVKRERNKPMGNEPMVLEMARVRTRPKEVRMTREEYRGRTGKEPEVGQSYTIDPSVPGKVESVSDQQVVIRFHAEPGTRVKTPLGEGEIRETARNYEIVINAKRGDLVRTGALVGRIANVDERMITIDYGHPFGYETLKCDVKVENAAEAESSKLNAKSK